MKFPGIDIRVAPRIVVSIATSEDGLVLESRDATLVGSLDLTDRMEFRIRTELTPAGAEVKSRTEITILADPPSPLDLLPRAALEGAGDVTTGAALRFIHGFMLNSIVSDYENWSGSPDFRRTRSAALMDVQVKNVPMN